MLLRAGRGGCATRVQLVTEGTTKAPGEEENRVDDRPVRLGNRNTR